MLIGNVILTKYGIRIYDVDGSLMEVSAQDALYLLGELNKLEGALYDIIRRTQMKGKINEDPRPDQPMDA